MGRIISKWILQLLGWRIAGRYPAELKKFVIIAMPHTSNWDLPLGILVRSILRARINFVAKDSLFRPLYGWFFRWLGGFPVDRSRSTQYVDAVVDIFKREERFVLTIAPEGTRSKVDRLRSGFYYIALGAGVPIVMVRMDYVARVVTFSDPFYPIGDKEADLRFILDFYKGARGKRPHLGIDEHITFS